MAGLTNRPLRWHRRFGHHNGQRDDQCQRRSHLYGDRHDRQTVTYIASYSVDFERSKHTYSHCHGEFPRHPHHADTEHQSNGITVGSSPILLTSGLSVTSGGAAVVGVTIKFYENSGTCTNLGTSTLLGTVKTDSSGTATYSWVLRDSRPAVIQPSHVRRL